MAALAGITLPPRWVARAHCGQGHPDAWWPERGDPGAYPAAQVALRVCAGCPVRVECLDYALDHGEREGIWGGTTPHQRAAIRRQRRHQTHRPQAA